MLEANGFLMRSRYSSLLRVVFVLMILWSSRYFRSLLSSHEEYT